jgi:hypothetical protein
MRRRATGTPSQAIPIYIYKATTVSKGGGQRRRLYSPTGRGVFFFLRALPALVVYVIPVHWKAFSAALKDFDAGGVWLDVYNEGFDAGR